MFGDTQAFSSFAVPDLDTARSFYGETLGVKIEDNAMGFLELHLAGDRVVMVYPKDDHQPAVFTILNFEVDDLEAAVDTLGERGVTMQRYEGFEQDEKGIVRDGSGPGIAWFTDPAGNVLSVVSRS